MSLTKEPRKAGLWVAVSISRVLTSSVATSVAGVAVRGRERRRGRSAMSSSSVQSLVAPVGIGVLKSTILVEDDLPLPFDAVNEACFGLDLWISGGKNLIVVGGPGQSRLLFLHCPQQGHR